MKPSSLMEPPTGQAGNSGSSPSLRSASGVAGASARAMPSPSQRALHPPRPTGAVDRTVRFLRGMGVAVAIFLFWTAAFALAWLVLPYVFLRERAPLARRQRMQQLVAHALRGFLRVLELCRLYSCRYVGELAALGQPMVLVANHPTLLDVTAVLAHLPSVCCVAKSSLTNSPLVGRLLRVCGHVGAGDGSLSAGMGVLEAVRTRLDEGFPVLVFPEGTRSPFGGLHPFKRGAFQIAERAGVPVLPLFLRCDPPALGKGTPVWLHPRRCPRLTVHVGAPLDTKGTDPRQLCKTVEQDFRSRLAARSGESASFLGEEDR